MATMIGTRQKYIYFPIVFVILLCLQSGTAIGASDTKKLPVSEGSWSPKSKGCGKKSNTDFNVSGKTLEFHGATCKIIKARNYGSRRYSVDISCQSGGQQFDDTATFDVYGKKRLILHLPNMGIDYLEYAFCRSKAVATKPAKARKRTKPRKGLQFTSKYEGNVGKSLVDVTLHYYKDGRVEGEYVTRKKGNLYQLSGDNYQNGVLSFKEYTRGKHTANVKLKKGRHQGILAWIGIMHNLDGRDVEVVFTKKRRR